MGRKCAHCDKENVPLQIEHIQAKGRSGSDRVSNLTLACEGMACVGEVTTLSNWQGQVLVIEASGRGAYQRTRLDRFGFARGYLMRQKSVKGFRTGDLVRATVPNGKTLELTLAESRSEKEVFSNRNHCRCKLEILPSRHAWRRLHIHP